MARSGKAAAPVVKLSENGRGGLLETVVEACKVLRLRYYHTHDARKSPHGFPDLVVTGPYGTIFRELKGDGGRVTAEQQAWIDDLRASGQDADVWWPADLHSGRITAELLALRRPPVTP